MRRAGTTFGDGAIKGLLLVVQVGPLLVLVILAAAMALIEPLFATTSNIQNLAGQSAVIATLGLGQLVVILTRGIDLSVGSMLALSSVMGGVMLSTSLDTGAPVILTMLLTGAAVGFVNGFVFVKGRIPHPFIVTLATLSLARGLALTISGGSLYTGLPPAVITLGQDYVLGVPVSAIVVAGLSVATWLFIRRMKWGRWIYATGGNPEGAARMGIPVGKVLISVFVFSGLMAGFAGLLTAGRTASGDSNAGNLAELDSIAAVIIGGASFFGGRGNVSNVLIGALTIGVIRNGLNLLDVSPFLQLIVIGAVVLIAVELDVIRTSLEGRLRVRRTGATS